MAKKQNATAAKNTKAATKKPRTKRTSWLSKTNAPLLDSYARQMKSFLKAAADGVIDDAEIKEQESRMVELMKEVEPQLSDELHAKITELLCEVTVYDLMQVMYTLQKNRPHPEFRG